MINTSTNNNDSINHIALKIIFLLIVLAVAVIVGGIAFFWFGHSIFFYDRPEIQAAIVYDTGALYRYKLSLAIPFISGVFIALLVNIIKILWLKWTVNSALKMEAKHATTHMQAHYFLRLIFTLLALLFTALVLPRLMNVEPMSIVIGMAIGLLTLQIAMYLVGLLMNDKPDPNDPKPNYIKNPYGDDPPEDEQKTLSETPTHEIYTLQSIEDEIDNIVNNSDDLNTL